MRQQTQEAIISDNRLDSCGESYIGNGRIVCRGRDIGDLIDEFSFEQSVFYQTQARLPSQKEETMLKHYLISLCEHADTSPSTHPPRVVSNVGGSFENAAIAFICGASGKNHFGALQEAMLEIQNIAWHVEHWEMSGYITEKIKQREKIPGFGHRFHKTEKHPDLNPAEYENLRERKDPRVNKLLELSEKIGWDGIYVETVKQIGRELYERKKIPINIDGIGAGILLDMKFSPEIAPLFPILGRLPMIARYHLQEKQEQPNRFIGLVDRNSPDYENRTVDLTR